MYLDSHCHLTCDALAPTFEGVLQRARANGVTGFLNIADGFESAQAAVAQTRQARKLGHAMWATAGVHPQNVAKWDGASLAELRALAGEPEVVAIGEIGIDTIYTETHPQYPGATLAVQEQVLIAQIELAFELDLPVVLHNREADDQLVEIVSRYPELRGVFHCFGSPLAVARRVLDFGFYLGFTGLVTFKNADAVREVARFCPLDRLLIETDSPYLAPVPYRGKTNEPSYLPKVAETVAGLRRLAAEEIGKITSDNARVLFGLG